MDRLAPVIMRVVGFGTYESSRHPRITTLLDGLRSCGDDVVEINEPLGFTTAERVRMLQRPWLGYRFVLRLLRRWASITRRGRGVRRAGPVDAVVVGYLGQFDVLLAALVFRRTPIVLDQLIFAPDTALDRNVRPGLKVWLLRQLDRLATSASDLVIVDTDESLDLLPAGQRRKGVAIPVGAPDNWVVERQQRARSSTLRVVYFGMYTPLHGTPVIARAIALLAGQDVHFTMIGTGQDRAEAERLAAGNDNVDWIDWADPGDLPALVARHDVCLGIFGTTQKSHRVVPHKVYQGMAAGCAVVTSRTPPQRRELGDSTIFVDPGDAEGLAGVIGELAGDPDRVQRQRALARARYEQRFAPAVIGRQLHEALVDVRRGPGKDLTS